MRSFAGRRVAAFAAARNGPVCLPARGPFSTGRGDRIRTCDLVDPNHALYQSELHPEFSADLVLARHRELGQFAQAFLKNGLRKGGQRGKRLICLALSEARSVRKAP